MNASGVLKIRIGALVNLMCLSSHPLHYFGNEKVQLWPFHDLERYCSAYKKRKRDKREYEEEEEEDHHFPPTANDARMPNCQLCKFEREGISLYVGKEKGGGSHFFHTMPRAKGSQDHNFDKRKKSRGNVWVGPSLCVHRVQSKFVVCAYVQCPKFYRGRADKAMKFPSCHCFSFRIRHSNFSPRAHQNNLTC